MGEQKEGKGTDSVQPSYIRDTPDTASPAQKKRFLKKPGKRGWFLIAALMFLAGITALAGFGAYEESRNRTDIAIPTEDRFFANHLAQLKANPPKADTPPQERAAYYQDLSFTYADMKDYRNAIKAFLSRERASTQDLKYYHYTNLASYYHEVGDNEAAQDALEQAIALLPPQDDPENGYYREREIANIEEMKVEYR